MKTAEQIIELIRSYHRNYAVQDNVDAAKVARVLERLLDEAEEPDLDELRRKYLGNDFVVDAPIKTVHK